VSCVLTLKVCELDLIFNFQKAYAILDELIIAGEMQESSKKAVLKIVSIRLFLRHCLRDSGTRLTVRWPNPTL
jgi:hypothetical protein